MKTSSLLLLATGLVLANFAGKASADELNFDNLNAAGQGNNMALPSNYGGFYWDTSFGVTDNYDYNFVNPNTGLIDGPQYNFLTFPTQPNAVFNWYDSVTVSSSTPFTFTGASFAGWGDGVSAPSITITGYNGATEVGSVTTTLSSNGFTFLSANIQDVTSLVFNDGANSPDIYGNPSSNDYWLMDDFTYTYNNEFNANNDPSVPDSGATAALLGCALAALVGYSWNSRRLNTVVS